MNAWYPWEHISLLKPLLQLGINTMAPVLAAPLDLLSSGSEGDC